MRSAKLTAQASWNLPGEAACSRVGRGRFPARPGSVQSLSHGNRAQLCRENGALSIWRGDLPPALKPGSGCPSLPKLSLWAAQPNNSVPAHRAYLAQSGVHLQGQNKGRLIPGPFTRALPHQNGNEKGHLLWQLDFSFWENSCGPKYPPTTACSALCAICATLLHKLGLQEGRAVLFLG